MPDSQQWKSLQRPLPALAVLISLPLGQMVMESIPFSFHLPCSCLRLPCLPFGHASDPFFMSPVLFHLVPEESCVILLFFPYLSILIPMYRTGSQDRVISRPSCFCASIPLWFSLPALVVVLHPIYQTTWNGPCVRNLVGAHRTACLCKDVTRPPLVYKIHYVVQGIGDWFGIQLRSQNIHGTPFLFSLTTHDGDIILFFSVSIPFICNQFLWSGRVGCGPECLTGMIFGHSRGSGFQGVGCTNSSQLLTTDFSCTVPFRFSTLLRKWSTVKVIFIYKFLLICRYNYTGKVIILYNK